MKKRIAPRRTIAAARGGFTLIEMLVATTLVVMMMLMFAQIYVAAIGSLGDQQAVARNDGKARLVSTLLIGDLNRGSFRSAPNSSQGILPLVKDDPVSAWQRGFFYLSENDQNNPVDDVLHFTASIKDARNRDPSMYYGRARSVSGVLEYNNNPTQPVHYTNHPDLDDGDTGNGVGASRDAEIVYFVRGGNLYRRVLLVRDVDLTGIPGTVSAQPSRGNVEFNGRINSAILPNPPNLSYFKAYDYAAYCRIRDIGDNTQDTVRFLGTDALQNHSLSPVSNDPMNPGYVNSTESLGCSMTRFGFAISANNQTATNADLTIQAITRARGTSVEYDSLGNFFGRPLHGETGSSQWGWPGVRTNPLLNPDLRCYPVPPTAATRPNELSSLNIPYRDPDTLNSRETEDLLLSNVEAFDVEVWDQGLVEDLNQNGVLNPGEDFNGNGFLDTAGGFVQLGRASPTLPTGYFHAAQRLNSAYGPRVSEDTDRDGFLDAGEDTNANGVLDIYPVFDTGHPDMWTENLAGSTWYKPPYRPLQYRFTGGGGVPAPVFPVRSANFWAASTLYQPGMVVFKVDGRGSLDTTFSTAYRCVVSGTSGNNPPDWPTVPGQPVTDGGVTWEAFDNRVGLQKIRITVRVRDPIEGVSRQFSIIHSFANPYKPD